MPIVVAVQALPEELLDKFAQRFKALMARLGLFRLFVCGGDEMRPVNREHGHPDVAVTERVQFPGLLVVDGPENFLVAFGWF